MVNQIILDGDEVINSTDWENKSKNIIKKLDEELFDSIDEIDSYDIRYSKDGDELSRTKHKVRKGELMPTISPAQVSAKLNRLMRVYKPMNSSEAKSLDDVEYLKAYGYYLDIISHINKYITFLGDKQLFSAFCNITSTVYNELQKDARYCDVFASIDDGFIHTNYEVSQAGLVDSKTTIAKLQTRDAGHSLVKSPDSLTIVQNNKIDKVSINEKLDRFLEMTKR